MIPRFCSVDQTVGVKVGWLISGCSRIATPFSAPCPFIVPRASSHDESSVSDAASNPGQSLSSFLSELASAASPGSELDRKANWNKPGKAKANLREVKIARTARVKPPVPCTGDTMHRNCTGGSYKYSPLC